MLKKSGMRLLADDLVANKKLYDQNTFGSEAECGTVCCLAGFCYRREIGVRKFNRLAKDEAIDDYECVQVAKKQLGIVGNRSPKLFDSIDEWPADLKSEYYSNGPRARVIVALKALQRLKDNGTIDSKKSAVHTRLPQLKALVKEQQVILAKRKVA